MTDETGGKPLNMREPTEAMVIGARSRYPDGDNHGPTLYHDIFRAMIRKAKEER